MDFKLRVYNMVGTSLLKLRNLYFQYVWIMRIFSVSLYWDDNKFPILKADSNIIIYVQTFNILYICKKVLQHRTKQR